MSAVLRVAANGRSQSPAAAILPVIDRLARTLDEENAAIARRGPVDYDAFNHRKSQGLLELNRHAPNLAGLQLGPALAGHMDVDGLHAFGVGHDAEVALGQLASESVTRTRFEDAPSAKAWFSASYDNLDRVLTFTEMKTIWHPAKI